MVFLATDPSGAPFALKRLLAYAEEVQIIRLEFKFLVSVVQGAGPTRIRSIQRGVVLVVEE